MKNIKSVKYNWHNAGSTIDRDGAGENYEIFTVGKDGVATITEVKNGNHINCLVETENGTQYRVFNPNFIEYL